MTGKLGSAILQMIVYYSALAPCITFTYLLRGVDIVSVLLLLAYTFCLSVLLCCVGLVFAGFSTITAVAEPAVGVAVAVSDCRGIHLGGHDHRYRLQWRQRHSLGRCGFLDRAGGGAHWPL